MSSAQRLVNGNTLITEANMGRVFEVTKEGEVVWEYCAGTGVRGLAFRANWVRPSIGLIRFPRHGFQT